MIGLTCDICGYQDKTELGTAVVVCKDGVTRCTPCQNLKQYGKKWPGDEEEVIDHEGDTDVVATWPIVEPKWASPLSDSGKPYNIR